MQTFCPSYVEKLVRDSDRCHASPSGRCRSPALDQSSGDARGCGPTERRPSDANSCTTRARRHLRRQMDGATTSRLQLTLNDARKSTAAENWREGGGLWDVAAVGAPLESLGRQRRKGTGREWREGSVSSGGRRRSCASCHTIKSDRDMIL